MTNRSSSSLLGTCVFCGAAIALGVILLFAAALTILHNDKPTKPADPPAPAGGPDEPLNLSYQRWLAAGTNPNLAKVSLARKIATIVLVMWKTEEEYDSSKHSKTVSP